MWRTSRGHRSGQASRVGAAEGRRAFDADDARRRALERRARRGAARVPRSSVKNDARPSAARAAVRQ